MQKQILVVEDDAVLNRLIVKQLRALEYDATGATNWAEADDFLDAHEVQANEVEKLVAEIERELTQ